MCCIVASSSRSVWPLFLPPILFCALCQTRNDSSWAFRLLSPSTSRASINGHVAAAPPPPPPLLASPSRGRYRPLRSFLKRHSAPNLLLLYRPLGPFASARASTAVGFVCE